MKQLTFDFLYGNKHIPYSVWFSDESDRVETIVFLGTVQINKIPEWVAAKCPPHTAVVQGAPHWHALPDGSDIPEFILTYTEDAVKKIFKNRKVSKVNVIGESQGAAALATLFASRDKYERYLGDVVLIQPLGFSKNIYYGTGEKKMKLFKRRVGRNASRQLAALLVDPKLRYNHRQLKKIANFADAVSVAQYASGLDFDITRDVQKLISRQHSVSVVCGSRDTIFPVREIRQTLSEHNLLVKIEVVLGVSHSPLATKQGTKLLNKAFSLLQLHG